jgi:hypothetical protein
MGRQGQAKHTPCLEVIGKILFKETYKSKNNQLTSNPYKTIIISLELFRGLFLVFFGIISI